MRHHHHPILTIAIWFKRHPEMTLKNFCPICLQPFAIKLPVLSGAEVIKFAVRSQIFGSESANAGIDAGGASLDSPQNVKAEFVDDPKELAMIEMEKPRKRRKWKARFLKTCTRCAECETFIRRIDAIAHEAITKGSGCACPELRLKIGDIQTCRRCAEWEAFIWWLHAVGDVHK